MFWLSNKKIIFLVHTLNLRPDNAAFHQSLHRLLRLTQPSETEVKELHYNSENSTCDPLKNTMNSPILMVSICMGKSIRIQKVE